MEENDTEIDLSQCVKIILKRKWLIILIVLLCTGISAVISYFVLKPVYQATVSLIIVKEEAKIFYEDKYTINDVTMYEKLLKTYAEIAQSNRVIQKTSESLKSYSIGEIRNSISIATQADTQILKIKFKSNSPIRATTMANEHMKVFIDESNQILPAGNLSVLDKAEASYIPISPNKNLNIIIAFFVSFMASICMAFFLEYLDGMDNIIKTEEQITKILDLPVLVSIPKYYS